MTKVNPRNTTDEHEINEAIRNSSPIVDPKVSKEVDESQAMTTVAPEMLKEMVGMGMADVDPLDIRPPQILLVQKLSDLDLMQTVDGESPKPGQFFHTGKRKIYDTFDCHILYAAKGAFTNRRKEGNPREPQYTVIGVLPEDMTLFGMNFRGSALYSLSPLFTAVNSMKAPMFSFIVTMETKGLENKKGAWTIPVARVGQVVSSVDLFNELYVMAKRFNKSGHEVVEAMNKKEEQTAKPEEAPPEDAIPF